MSTSPTNHKQGWSNSNSSESSRLSSSYGNQHPPLTHSPRGPAPNAANGASAPSPGASFRQSPQIHNDLDLTSSRTLPPLSGTGSGARSRSSSSASRSGNSFPFPPLPSPYGTSAPSPGSKSAYPSPSYSALARSPGSYGLASSERSTAETANLPGSSSGAPPDFLTRPFGAPSPGASWRSNHPPSSLRAPPPQPQPQLPPQSHQQKMSMVSYPISQQHPQHSSVAMNHIGASNLAGISPSYSLMSAASGSNGTHTPGSAQPKRKRSHSPQHRGSEPDDEKSPSDKGKGSAALANDATDADGNKRIKTPRACDSCRRKKIRCDIIEPLGLCVHCKTYSLECTFYLPISETRFKKKRDRELDEVKAAASAAAAAAVAGRGGIPQVLGPGGAMIAPPLARMMPPLRNSKAQEWPPAQAVPLYPWQAPRQDGHSILPIPAVPPVSAAAIAQDTSSSSEPPEVSRAAMGPASVMAMHRSSSDSSLKDGNVRPPPDSSVLGPTSIAYLVHSTAFVPSAALEDHDIQNHQTFEIGSSGDGIIKFHKIPRARGSVSSDEELPNLQTPEVVRAQLAGDVAEKLVNSYFEKLAPLFPIVTKSDFLHLSPPPPLLLNAICCVAALSRDVPREVLSTIRSRLNVMLRDADVLSNSSSTTIKALLIMSLHQDVHGSSAVQCGVRSWNRLGSAIRMAQDLGLHRDASGRDDVDEDSYFLEQKRRIWGSCVTSDRWASIYSGRPLAIELTDCDVRLPSPFEVLRKPIDPLSVPGEDQPFLFFVESLKLSILFGRVMKTIYSPTGLMKASDEEISGLLGDIDAWREALPARLQFTGSGSPPEAGILHLAHACLQNLFFRVFLRISYVCPTHLKFSMTIERMTMMLTWAKESIDWIGEHPYYFDTLGLISYSVVSCAILMYHAHIRRGDEEALERLHKLRDYFQQASKAGDSADDSVRAKSGAVISLLVNAATGAFPKERYSGALNPTAGVSNRKTHENVTGLKFRPDPTRPGGGVYVAESNDVVLRDLPKGTIVLKDLDEANRMPVFTWSPTSGNWQMISGKRETATLPENDPNAAPGAAKLVTMFPMATGLASMPRAPPDLMSPTTNALGAPFGNVNPDLNDISWNPAANFVLESSADLAPNLQGTGVDPLLLDGLPQHLDFDAWSSWFARFQPNMDGREGELAMAS